MQPTIQFSIFVTLFFFSKWRCNAINEEVSLQSYLDGISYSIYARPVSSPNSSTQIRITYFLEHIVNVDSSAQTITLSGLLFMYWNDARLRWTPSSYGKVVSTRRGVSKVWTPHFSITNSAGDPQRVIPDTQNDQITLDNTGNIYYEIKLLTTTSCSMDVKNFPYDSQYCTLKLNIEGYTKSQIEIVTEHEYDSKNFYIESREWNISNWGNSAQYFSLMISKVNNITLDLPQYIYWVLIKRQPDYYTFLLIYPMVMLSILLLLVFFLPIESGEKIGLGITIMLSFVVFLLLLDSLIPKSSNLPYVSNYISSQIILSTITIFISAFILRIYNVDPKIKMSDASYKFAIVFLGTCVGYFGFCRRAPSRQKASKKSNQNDENRLKIEPNVKDSDKKKLIVEPEEEWQTMAKILDNFCMIIGVIVVFFVAIMLLLVLPTAYVNSNIPTVFDNGSTSNS